MRSVPAFVFVILCASAAEPPAASAQLLRRDDRLHLGLSSLIAFGTYGVVALVDERESLRVGIGAAVALGAGIAKELWDLSGRGDPSWRDLGFDLVGTGIGLLAGWLLGLVVRRVRGPEESPPEDAASPLAVRF
jgi:putative lipoprotein